VADAVPQGPVGGNEANRDQRDNQGVLHEALTPQRGGARKDIRASVYFTHDSEARARWAAARATRLEGAPGALGTLRADASQAAAHLSWDRVRKPDVQRPSTDVTRFLLTHWVDFQTCLGEPYNQLFIAEWRRLYRRQ
jgi:hypothetical protein